MTTIGQWATGARPKTLPAAMVPVVVGTAATVSQSLGWSGGVIWWRAGAALIVALALQIATNYANDYSDGIRGTDDDRVGPMRLVGSGIAEPSRVKAMAFAWFGVAAIVGLLLALAVGWELVVVGALSIAAGWFYTGGSKPYGYRGFGELFVFVFFGLVATVGSAYVQPSGWSGQAWLAAVAVGCLATALLVANNLRDIPSDRATGKQTLAVRLGDQQTRRLYQLLLVVPFLVVVALALDRPLVLVALLAAPVTGPAITAVRAGATGRSLIAVLEATARTQLVFGVALALGLWFG